MAYIIFLFQSIVLDLRFNKEIIFKFTHFVVLQNEASQWEELLKNIEWGDMRNKFVDWALLSNAFLHIQHCF